MTFQSFDTWWWPFLYILLAGWIPTSMWRYLGVYFAGGIKEDAEILVLVRALATALVAAVIAKLVLYPEGPLADTPLTLRLICVAIGFSTYLFAGRRIGLGVFVAEIVLVGSLRFAQ